MTSTFKWLEARFWKKRDTAREKMKTRKNNPKGN